MEPAEEFRHVKHKERKALYYVYGFLFVIRGVHTYILFLITLGRVILTIH